MHAWGHVDVDRHRLRARARASPWSAEGCRIAFRTYLLTFSVCRRTWPAWWSSRLHTARAIKLVPLACGLAFIAPGPGDAGRRGVRHGPLVLPDRPSPAWVAFFKSGIDPIVVGPHLRAADLRLLGEPRIARASLGGVPAVPRAAHGPNWPSRPRKRGAHRGLAERPAGPAVAPVDQLRYRAAVRAWPTRASC